MTDPAQYLARNLEKGSCRLGQVLITKDFCLRHISDGGREDLIRHTDPHAAIELARYDKEGKYRPLKTAPNLGQGWLLELGDIRLVLLALDFFYPAAIGTAAAREQGALEAIALRVTLERQTGMYAVVKKIADAEAGQVIMGLCRGQPGCMRRILWNISPEQQLPLPLAEGNSAGSAMAEREIPLLCAEACNLLVAAGREVVKKSDPKS